MTKAKTQKRKFHSTKPVEMPQVPFEEAVKRLWASPPQPNVAKKKKAKKRG